jgi:antitoxin component YwqK of YwqJK toxin-antitoxin module
MCFVKHGKYITKYKNEYIKGVCYYHNGVRIGVHRYYHKNGLPSEVSTWENGSMISIECWDINGNIITGTPQGDYDLW